MTQKEQARLKVLNGVLQEQVRVEEAAEVLGVSERHAWRILAAYRKEGAAALAHGNRGRRPTNAIPQGTREQVITLARTRYVGLNHTHLTELLAEREGLFLARATVRRILVAAGVPSPRRRRPPRHRCRRERMPREGMLMQIDGSRHDWLEGRGPWLSLLLAVDDATGTVPYALFREQEDTDGYFLLLREIIRRRGIPLALYSDRHGVFQRPRTERETLEEELGGERQPTQFGRALRELGIQAVFARSPQAKGRVERTGGTFQDRLVSELRLAGACTAEEANRVLWGYLPRFNARFGVPPAQEGTAYRQPPAELDMEGILCHKHSRTVGKDNTVRFAGHVLQVLPGKERPSYAQARVEVQERLDGSLVVCYQGKVLATQVAPPRPVTLRARGWVRSDVPEPLLCLVGAVIPDNGAHGNGGGEWGRVDEGAEAGSLFHVGGGSGCPYQPGQDGHSQRRSRKTSIPRQPTPRQQARWETVQAARPLGMSLRAIARQLGIARNTVSKYAAAPSPPLYAQRRSRPNDSQGGRLTESLINKP